MSSIGALVQSPATDPFITAMAARVTALDAAAAIAAPSTTIDFVISNGTSVIATGIQGDREVRVSGTITAVRLFADVSGSIVVDIWKDSFANFPPVVGDSICAAAKPTLASAFSAQDTDLTGWNTGVVAGDVLRFNVDSVATVKKVTVSLTISPVPPVIGGGGGGGGGGGFTSYLATLLFEPGLVLALPLYDSTGTLAVDDGPHGYPGTYFGTPTLGAPGPFADGSTAVTFNGSTQGVTIPHNAALNLGDVWSIEAWVQRGALGTARVIMGKGTGAYELAIDTNGALLLRKSNTSIMLATSADIGTGWHHVVGTKNGAAGHLYVDGAEPAHGTFTNATCTDNGTVLQVASDWDGGGLFNGTMAWPALYNVALSPAAVAAHYAAAVTVGAPPVSPLPSTIPATVDKTGATNCHDALEAYLNSVPPGTTVNFDPAGIYRVDTALKLQGRVNLDLNGQGATIQAHGTGFNENYSLFYFVTFGGGNNGIKVHDFTLIGSSTTPGVFAGGEGQHGILFDGTTNFEVYGCTGSAFFGDMVEVNSGAAFGRIHDNICTNTGRNAVSVIYGNHVEIDHNTWWTMGYMPFDIEPNKTGGGAGPSSFINYHHNTSHSWTNAWFALDGSSTGFNFNNVVIADNISIGKSLLSLIVGPGRKQGISFLRNSSDVSAAGPVLRFTGVDGLTVTGNNQPLSSGVLVSTTSCTAVVSTPNP